MPMLTTDAARLPLLIGCCCGPTAIAAMDERRRFLPRRAATDG
jgi:hypothetical protein